MKTTLVLSIAIASCIVLPWQWLAAQEEIKYPSPDGRFALRITDDQKVELIEKASGTVMVDLGEAWHSAGRGESQVLVWSPDSKRVAYGNRGNKEGEVSVFFVAGHLSSGSLYRRSCRLPISIFQRTVVP